MHIFSPYWKFTLKHWLVTEYCNKIPMLMTQDMTYQLQIRSSARPDTQWQVVECCIVDDQFSPVGQETGSRKILLSRQSSTNDHLQISPPVLSNSLVSVKNISGRGHTLICILTTKHNKWRKEVKENFEKTEEFLNKGVCFLDWLNIMYKHGNGQ